MSAGRRAKQRVKTLFGGGVLACSLFGVAIAGPFEDGQAAYRRGDYATAIQLFRPLAEQGNDAAQYLLGLMYNNGLGVRQDDAQAVAWYRKAADQGYAEAQLNLGPKYSHGQGVPQDFILALMWANLAASRAADAKEREMAIRNRDRAAALMTPGEITEAQRMVREWKPK